MAIASQNSTAYSTQASVDQLLEQISAKVRAQLNQEAQRQNIAPEDTTPKNITSTVTASNHVAPEIKPQAKVEVKPDFRAEIRPEPRTELYSEYPTNFADVNIRQMAAEGYFQAIAYWLNERLVPQNVYAQVLADERPGRLKVLVEFERSPQRDRLIRLVCNRLYQLNSDVIEGVHLIVRALGAAKTDWEKAIRIPTAAERRQSKKQLAQPVEPPTKRSAAPKLVHESSSSQRARQVVRTQFKFFRAALVCGSAIAAFCFGSFTELILADRLSLPSIQLADGAAKSTPLPWYEEAAEPGSSPISSSASSLATTVSFRPASRFKGRTVEAALETVAVIPHDQVANPSDPTVTLLFGGDISLNNFVFDDASEVEQLFSAVDIYRQADVAMVGLAEPLAYASTSLQEDFHHRTRPQAVEALQAGSIDLVGLASEGMMTYGTRGLEETLDNLDRHGIYHVGAGRNQLEAHRPEILEVKGQRIAYLGYNPEALAGAEGEKAGVALASSENRQHIVDDIRAIRSQVDWVVVNYRWGDAVKNLLDTPEDEEKGQAEDPTKDPTVDPPKDWQRKLAHEAVDAGADLVVGYYPNHIQGAEIYRDRPIAYSLGDNDFDTASPKDHNTAALKVSLRNRQMKVEFLPITIHDAKLQMATGEQGKEILQTIRSASKTLEQPLRFPTVLKAGPEQLPDSSKADTFIVPDKDDWVPKLQPDNSEPDSPKLDSPQPDSPNLDSDNNATPVNPTMKESDALFTPKPGGSPTDAPSPADTSEREEDAAGSAVPYDKLDEQWRQNENWKNNLPNEPPSQASGETSGETWGEKQTESAPEFVPIPEGAIQRHNRGDEPEFSSTDDPQSPSKTYPESYSESDPESSNSEAWKDPFAEESQSAPSLPEQVNPGN